MDTPNMSVNERETLSPKGFVNKAQVARWLMVSTRTVDDYMQRGLLVYYKFGRTVRFKLEDLDEHLRKTCRIGARSVNSR